MSAERLKVLEMLAEGKITTGDAEQLLDKLQGTSEKTSAPASSESAGAQRPRFLRIQIDRPGREAMNVRVPLSLMRTGMGLVAVLPPQVSEKLASRGIDLAGLRNLKGEDLVEALQDLQVDVGGSEGKKVRIFCE